MIINLQHNSSENNAVYKSVSLITSVTGTMREESSIINPIIEINGVNAATLAHCNYAQIAVFGRSYFVKDITAINANAVRVSLHSDVLSSFASEFMGLSAVIGRQENAWNLYLNDGMFKTYQNSDVYTKSFPSGFSSQNFVLAVSGS
jgi:hypothetical protein